VVTTYVERGFMSELEKCWRCGKACNPAFYVYSKKKATSLPVCGKCGDTWLEKGRMPK